MSTSPRVHAALVSGLAERPLGTLTAELLHHAASAHDLREHLLVEPGDELSAARLRQLACAANPLACALGHKLGFDGAREALKRIHELAQLPREAASN